MHARVCAPTYPSTTNSQPTTCNTTKGPKEVAKPLAETDPDTVWAMIETGLVSTENVRFLPHKCTVVPCRIPVATRTIGDNCPTSRFIPALIELRQEEVRVTAFIWCGNEWKRVAINLTSDERPAEMAAIETFLASTKDSSYAAIKRMMRTRVARKERKKRKRGQQQQQQQQQNYSLWESLAVFFGSFF